MAKYRITDPRYGREMIISGDAPPTQEQINNLFNKTFSKELVFDDLVNNKKYVEDMKAAYKDREGKEFTGDVNSLLEGEFEYWNWVDNNLTATGTAIATDYFEDMDKEQKQRMLRLYDIYDRTQAFGEGSRSFWEQFKGVGKAITLDPTNWAGGYGVLTKLLTKSATKGIFKKAFEKLLFPASVGATWAAVAETEKQAVEKDLEKRVNYDWGKVGESAKTGAALGPLFPAGAKFVGKTAEGAYNVAKNIATRQTEQKAKEGFVRTLGGADVARKSTLKEAAEKIGARDSDLYTEGPVNSIYDIFNSSFDKVKKGFEDAYKKVNFSKLTIDDVNKVAQELVSEGGDILSVRQVLDDVAKGNTSPTRGLKRIKQNINKQVYQSYFGKGEFKNFDEDKAQRLNDIVSNAWKDAAKKSNNLEALKLDADYSKWLNFKKDSSTLLKRLGDDQKIITTMNQLTTNPKSSGVNFKNLMNIFSELGKFSDNPALVGQTRKDVINVIKGDLLSGEGQRLEKFLLDSEGVKTLKKLFPEQKDLFDDFSTIIKNAQGSSTTPLWISRFIASVLGYRAGGGEITGGVTTAISLKSLDSALNSKGFRKLAMDAYRQGDPNEKKINGMVKWLKANTDITDEGLKSFRQQMLGGATLVGGISATEDYTDVENVKKIGQALPFVGEYIQ